MWQIIGELHRAKVAGRKALPRRIGAWLKKSLGQERMVTMPAADVARARVSCEPHFRLRQRLQVIARGRESCADDFLHHIGRSMRPGLYARQGPPDSRVILEMKLAESAYYGAHFAMLTKDHNRIALHFG